MTIPVIEWVVKSSNDCLKVFVVTRVYLIQYLVTRNHAPFHKSTHSIENLTPPKMKIRKTLASYTVAKGQPFKFFKNID